MIKQKTCYSFVCFPILILLANMALAQAPIEDSSFLQTALSNRHAVYRYAFGTQSALYNGSQYHEYPFLFTEGNPYFHQPDAGLGSVVYDGVRYDSVVLRYNQATDEVIINVKARRLLLLTSRITAFRVFDNNFIALDKDSVKGNIGGNGFYNVLYEGRASLLKRQVKTVRETIATTNELQHFVDARTAYFLRKDDVYFPVRSKSDFLDVLADRKKELQQYIRSAGLNFRKEREAFLLQATAFYDSLKNK